MSSDQMVLIPTVSEKSFQQAAENTYMFSVPSSANKVDVKREVENQFKVKVTNVNISVAKGKAKKSYRKRLQPIDGQRKSVKRAYVTLKEGDKLPFFEEAE